MKRYIAGRAPGLVRASNAALWPIIVPLLPADLPTLVHAVAERHEGDQATGWMPPEALAMSQVQYLVRKGWLVEAGGR